ncbi:MFS transporter [Herbiconiux sp. P17]
MAIPSERRGRRLRPSWAYGAAIVTSLTVPVAAGASSPLFVLLQKEWHFPDWQLTAAFAVYAFTLLLALLFGGSVSDHIGRRPVLIGSLIAMLVSSVVFVLAENVEAVIVARAIQGLATGMANSTFAALIIELAAPHRKRAATVITSMAPVAGLALGAALAGIVIQFVPSPAQAIFMTLGVIFLIGSVVVRLTPETISARSGVLRSLIPHLAIPPSARLTFLAIAPLLFAAWMANGLFLGLAPSIDHALFGVTSGTVNGLVAALEPACAAVAGVAFGRTNARIAAFVGGSTLLVGMALLAAGVTFDLFPLFITAAVFVGIGFGTSFSAAIRSLAPRAQPHERGGLFAAIYLVSYLAYGAPTLVAGLFTASHGFEATTLGYALVTVALTVFGVAAQLRRSAPPAPSGDGPQD